MENFVDNFPEMWSTNFISSDAISDPTRRWWWLPITWRLSTSALSWQERVKDSHSITARQDVTMSAAEILLALHKYFTTVKCSTVPSMTTFRQWPTILVSITIQCMRKLSVSYAYTQIFMHSKWNQLCETFIPTQHFLSLSTTTWWLILHRKFSLNLCSPPRSANENSTCIPSTGIFMLFKQRSNYSKAAETCSTYGGNLAHIVSEHRNIKLSALLRLSTATSKKERNAYVGLSEPRKRGEFLTSFNEPLQCFNFRAFALGHPSLIRARGCVALTPEGFWKVFRCNRKLLFVCELLTSGGLGC